MPRWGTKVLTEAPSPSAANQKDLEGQALRLQQVKQRIKNMPDLDAEKEFVEWQRRRGL